MVLGCKKDDGPVQPKPDVIDTPDPKSDYENRPSGTCGLVTVADGSENIEIRPTLSWEQATDPDGAKVVYNLYSVTAESPKTLVAENLGTTSYELSDRLEYESEYHWQVVAKDDKGANIESGSRSFATRKIAIEWQVNLRGSGNDVANDVQSTIEGGFVVTGTSSSFDGNIQGNKGSLDFWILKLN